MKKSVDNQQSTLREMALFAGAGGGILGGHLLGWKTVCAVEWEPYPASVLCARQNDGILPPFPIWDDVQTFDGRPWRGIVDVISGGFPCQDISSAGRGAGITGERSGLWKEFARIIGEVRPRFVFVENSPMLTSRGLGVVLGDLASLGYDAEWGVVSAEDCGAPHKRERIWIVAHSTKLLGNGVNDNAGIRMESCALSKFGDNSRQEDVANSTNSRVHERGGFDDVGEVLHKLRRDERDGLQGRIQEKSSLLADTDSPQREKEQLTIGIRSEHPNPGGTSWWSIEPDVGRVANGVAARVDRLKAIGNGQVPIVAATAFKILAEAR